MAMWEVPAAGDDRALTTPANEAGAPDGDTCPTCGGPPGPGKVGRRAACVEGEWAKLRAEMGDEWYRRHRYRKEAVDR